MSLAIFSTTAGIAAEASTVSEVYTKDRCKGKKKCKKGSNDSAAIGLPSHSQLPHTLASGNPAPVHPCLEADDVQAGVKLTDCLLL